MAKESEDHNEKKGSPSMKHGDKEHGQGKGSDKSGDNWKQGRDESSGNRKDNWKQGREESFGNGKEKWNQGQEKWPDNMSDTLEQSEKKGADGLNDFLQPGGKEGSPIGGQTKGGCLQKTLVLILPFIAVGTFLLLRS